jgi:hypothetical protein
MESSQTTILFNGKFFYTQSYTYSGSIPDPDGIEIYLDGTASNIDLGSAVVETLRACKPWFEGIDSDALSEVNMRKIPLRSAFECGKYGYKNEKELYLNMVECVVTMKNGSISIQPTDHNALRNHRSSLTDGFVNVEIPASSSMEELGAAIRLGLSRCTNTYADKLAARKAKKLTQPQ